MTGRRLPGQIALLVADVDSALVTPDKVLPAQAAAAVGRVEEADIDFTLISSRPPQGMALGCTAVIGDMMNDVSLSEVAGLAITMGQAPEAVKASADLGALSNADEGFADAVARFVLRRASETQAAT